MKTTPQEHERPYKRSRNPGDIGKKLLANMLMRDPKKVPPTICRDLTTHLDHGDGLGITTSTPL